MRVGEYKVSYTKGITKNLARAPAEWYPECAQLKVTGSGTATPGPEFLGRLPGSYKVTGKSFSIAGFEFHLY
jgi:hypothetical protein